MNGTLKSTTVALLFTAMSLAAPAGAQTYTPAPSPEATSTVPSDNGTPVVPMHTMMPSGATKAPAPKGKIKQLKTGTLTFSQVAYAMTHQAAEIKQVKAMKKVDFNNVRVVKLSSAFKLRLHLHVDTGAQTLAYDPFFVTDAMVAQTNGSNSPIANLQYVLANINVSNALNNILNGSNIGVNVSLADVLNGNKIGLSQVLGVYVNSFGIINTIIK